MVSKETDTNDAMGIGEGRGSPSPREGQHSKMPSSARMSRDGDQSAAAKAKLATTNGAGLMMEVAIRCTVPSCSCECFTPGKMHVRYCDTCKHGWVPHALDKLGFRHLYHHSIPIGGGAGGAAGGGALMSPHHGVEAVQPNVAFDIASLVLYGCQALPIRLKILLDRLFSVLQQEEVLQVLHGFGWTHEDYARGYVLTDPHGAVLDRWNMCSREEEPLVLQQFLRFGETRAITQQLLSQESADLFLHALPPTGTSLRALPPPPPRIDSDIKKFIERTGSSRAKEDPSASSSPAAAPAGPPPPTSQPSAQHHPPPPHPAMGHVAGAAVLHHVHQLHQRHQHQTGSSRPPSPSSSTPSHHVHHAAAPSEHHQHPHHHAHFLPHLHHQLHPQQGGQPNRPPAPPAPVTTSSSSSSSASLLPPPPLSFAKMPPAVNGPAPNASPATPTSPLSASPLNRLQSMQPFDFRKERSGSNCPPGGSPEPVVPQSPGGQQPPPPPPPPPVRRRPSVASDSGLNLSVQGTGSSPTRGGLSQQQHMHYGGPNAHGGFKSDVSGSEYGGSDDENSVSALNLSRDRPEPAIEDRRRSSSTSSHHHARKASTPVKRQWAPLNLGTQLINPSTGKKRVQCNVCLKTFCDKGALKIHFSAVHLREMHRCTVEGCNMMFSSRRSRNRHSANPNPKLHSPHLRRKISPHDGRSSQPHPLLMAPPHHHQSLGGLPAAAAALSPALAGLGAAAGPFNAMAAAAAAAFPLLATPPPGELQRAADHHHHQSAAAPGQHHQTNSHLQRPCGPPAPSVTSSSASSPSSDLKYSLDLSVHRYGDGRRGGGGPGGPGDGVRARLGSSSSSSDVEDDLDDDLEDEDDMEAFSSHDDDDEDDVRIYLSSSGGGRSRRRRRHGDRRTASEASDGGPEEAGMQPGPMEGAREGLQDEDRHEEDRGETEARAKREPEEGLDLTGSPENKRFKAECHEGTEEGGCNPLRLTQAKLEEQRVVDGVDEGPQGQLVVQPCAENGPTTVPATTASPSSSSSKAGVRKRKSRNPTRCAQPLPEDTPSNLLVMSSSEDDADALATAAAAAAEARATPPGDEEDDPGATVTAEELEDCEPECLKVEPKTEAEDERKREDVGEEEEATAEPSKEKAASPAVKEEDEDVSAAGHTIDLSKNASSEEKKSPTSERADTTAAGEQANRADGPQRATEADCPSNGGAQSDGDESLDSSHALRQLENLSQGHFGDRESCRGPSLQGPYPAPGGPSANHPFNLGLVPGPNSPPSPSSDRGDRDAESLSNPDSPSGDSSQQGLGHFRDSSGFMGVVDVPIDKENPRRCPVCGKIFQNHFGVKTHYQNVHLKLMHKCTVDGCNAAFPSKRSRDRHSANLNLHRKLLSTSSSDKSMFGDKSPFASLAANPALHGEFLARLYADTQALPLNLEAFKNHLPAAGAVPTGIGGLAEHLMVNGDRLGPGGLPPPPLLLPSLGFAGFGGLDHFGAALAAGMNGGRGGPNSSASSGSPSPPIPLSLLRHPLGAEPPQSGGVASTLPANAYYCLEEDDPTPEVDGGLRCRFCLKPFPDGASLKEHYERHHLSEMFGCTVEGCGKMFSSRHRRNQHSQDEAAHSAAARAGNGSPSPPPECS